MHFPEEVKEASARGKNYQKMVIHPSEEEKR